MKIRSVKVEVDEKVWNHFVGLCKMRGESVQSVLGKYVVEVVSDVNVSRETKVGSEVKFEPGSPDRQLQPVPPFPLSRISV